MTFPFFCVNNICMSEPYTKPFRGILYDREKIGDISGCVCPPYDVIPDTTPYFERSPYNAIRLELPRPLPDNGKYEAARQTFTEWCRRGVLAPDGNETIYIYEQEFEADGTARMRRGFIALNRLDKKRILTHEQTRKKAKEDRERLFTSLGAFTSLVFGMYEDRTFEIEALLETADKEEIYDFLDDQSIRNRFYRMVRPSEIDRLQTLMNARNIYVADGHHRLDVSYRLNIPYIPLYLTNMYSAGVVILPYHRMVKLEQNRNLESILTPLAGNVDVRSLPMDGIDSARTVLRDIARAPVPSYVLYSAEDPSRMFLLTATGLSKTGSGPLDRLKVNILHKKIMNDILGIREEEISFSQDPEEILSSVRDGKADLAFLLPPTTVQEVKEIADNGLDMPPKSTFFHPKILTGLVFHKYV